MARKRKQNKSKKRDDKVITRDTYTKFWFDYDTPDTIENKDVFEIIRLAAFLRSCKNFVSILTGRTDIQVKYATADASYTDGKTITITSSINNNMDSIVGLALHEASHILLTDFALFKSVFLTVNWDRRKQYISQEMLESAINKFTLLRQWNYTQAIDSGGSHETKTIAPSHPDKKLLPAEIYLLTKLKELWNWVEDRRIDNYIYTHAPGYQGYYEALYERYFTSDAITKTIKTDLYADETVESYMFRICNLINPASSLDKLTGLRDIYNLIDLPNISRLRSSHDTLDLASAILKIIVQHATAITPFDKHRNPINTLLLPQSSQNIKNGSTLRDLFDISVNELNRLLEEIRAQKDFIDNNIGKSTLSKEKVQEVNSIADAGVTLDNLTLPEFDGYNVNVLFIGKVTESFLRTNKLATHIFDLHTRSGMTHADAVNEGIVFGTMLGRKLQLRNEVNSLKYTRLPAGSIDKRLMASLGYNNENIFSNIFIDKYKHTHIHISLDVSSSMRGRKIHNAIKTVMAIVKACSMISNIDCVVTSRGEDGVHGIPCVCVLYDSRIDTITHAKKTLSMISTDNTTPESLCYDTIMERVFPKPKNDLDFYFLNFSDGEPFYISNDRLWRFVGQPAVAHCKRMINKMKKEYAANIISYFINDGEAEQSEFYIFREMYGLADSHNINTNSITAVATTMNKKFLEKNTAIKESTFY